MVGANALLGEILRIALPDLARKFERPWKLAASTVSYPPADQNDPLRFHDDPSEDAQAGILARDGGHFEAQFISGVSEFADAAGSVLRDCLPGLRYRISIDGIPVTKSQVQLSTELPVFAPCEWTGRSLASATVRQGDEQFEVSQEVARRHEAAKRTEDGSATDLASLLSAKTRLKSLQRAQDLKMLVDPGYLALIHADGNGVGDSAGEDELERASFFHRNRVLLRRALHSTINEHCPEEGLAPLIPLMLGGDDLLLVCRAEIALPFVVTLCQKLASLQSQDTERFLLTLGLGVIVAKPSIPIHRLHDVAEQLAGSAKRRYRGGLMANGEKSCSVVDWAVYSTAWVDDPVVVRRRHWLRGDSDDRRILSQRPIDVLTRGPNDHTELDTLEGLIKAAGRLTKAPRSQLRYLIDQLPYGRALSELAYNELSAEAAVALEEIGVTSAFRRSIPSGPWRTELLDLVEIVEIARSGRSTKRVDLEKETAHD